MRASRPVRVSFSGLDGAGKTRQIDALVSALGVDHSVEVIWLPTKVWPEPLLNRLPPGFRSRLGPKRTAVAGAAAMRVAPARGHLRDTLRSVVWVVIATFAAVSVGLSLRHRASKSRADLLVLDRYRLDSLVKLHFWYGEVSPDWLSRVVRALAPTPDVEFLLRVDPAVAYARKPEQWSVAQLSMQAGLYDRFAAGPLHVVTLDAQGDPEIIAREVGSQVRAVLDGA
jgi:thymidylate kinase